MANMFRTFGLLLYKALLVHYRQWKMSLYYLIPISLVILIQAVRDFSVQSPVMVNTDTYYDIDTKNYLIGLIRHSTNFYYVPDNLYTRSIMESTRLCLQLPSESVTGFSSEDDMINAYINLQAQSVNVNIIAIIFEQVNTFNIRYKIRQAYEIPSKPFKVAFDPPAEIYYMKMPFVQLQMCVDEALIKNVSNSMIETQMSIQRVPEPPHVEMDQGDIVLRELLCVFTVSTFLLPLIVEISYPAKEKHIGINVLMAMNGVRHYQNLLTWLISGILFSTIYVVPIIILLKNTFTGNVKPYLYYSNGFIFWLILTVHVAHLISFGMHGAAYFSKPRYASIILTIIYAAASSFYTHLANAQMYSIIPYLGILFPNMLLQRFLEEVNTNEIQSLGIQWSNMFLVGNMEYGISGSIGFVLILSILGIFLHFLLALYINAILPGKYGIRKNPLYFLKYLRKNKVFLDEDAEEFDYDRVDNENFEPVTKGALTPGIQIRNLTKTYKPICLRRSAVQALKGVSMDLYKGQITALLGHNGAGKTTLMSILTGVISSSEGKVLINGKNIAKYLQTIRDDLGLCPQENMFFPDLNVYEQLELFGLLKGVNKTRKEVRHNVDSLLDKLKLREKRNVLPSTLSGGQKRRLCLGLALVSDASTIILDEPTSGMDPETRRDIWDMILKIRGKKTILISTHNMEEADILGDRIAILHGGRLKCYGTSMFLKKQYGYGHLEVTLSTKSWCNSDQIINQFDPRTQQISIDSEKIVLSVPNSDTLPQCLDKIESQKKKLGVTGISVSLITLEEVFLRVIKNENNDNHLNEIFYSPSQKVVGWTLLLQTVLALYQKKLVYTKKNFLYTLLYVLILPLFLVVLLSFTYITPKDSTDVYPMGLDMYRYPETLYSSDNDTFGVQYKNAVELFGGHAKAIKDKSVTAALLDQSSQDIVEYHNNYIVSAEFNISNGIMKANAFYSSIAIHSIPLSVNLLSNALIKAAAGEEYSIHISRQKLPNPLSATDIIVEAQAMSMVMIFCFVFFPIASMFVLHPFKEMETKIKQLQRMTGVSSFSYWGTMFSFDFLAYAIIVLVIVVAFYITEIILDYRLYYKTEILIISELLLLFGINSLLISYIFSFLNKSRTAVINMLSLLPIGFVMVQYILHMVLLSFAKLKILHTIQKRLFRVIPHVSLFHAQYTFFTIALNNARCRRLPNPLQNVVCQAGDICCGLDCTDGVCKEQLPYFSDFNSDMSLGECVVYLCVTPFLYFAILIILEERLFDKLYSKVFDQKLRNACDLKDEEVAKEKEAVAYEIRKLRSRGSLSYEERRISRKENGMVVSTIKPEDLENSENDNNSLFLVYELSKYYGKLLAVREINFRVKQRECFGLLGVNGAGKSTTFRMLTGEEMPNSGIMYLGRSEIRADRKNYLAQMGYCPQTDALITSLNSFDHLRLFAQLRGIPRSKVDLEVNKWINRLNLNACMHQPSGTYSGGNKRRLNIAISLIGSPTLVLLDEPTTGVDPAARRSLWNIIQSCQAMGQATILTSHSMEECEALCNRLVIMVKGQLVCIGASQELKQRFGAGYDIHIKLNPSRTDNDVTVIKGIMESSLSCELRDENLGLIAYHVTDNATTWEKMYGTMSDLKQRFSCIEDYAVLSATLEQLFIQFARGTELRTEETSVSPSTAALSSV